MTTITICVLLYYSKFVHFYGFNFHFNEKKRIYLIFFIIKNKKVMQLSVLLTSMLHLSLEPFSILYIRV